MTHNRVLYHCVTCGRVAHVELNVAAPQCCGRQMERAGVETVHDDESERLTGKCCGSHEVAGETAR